MAPFIFTRRRHPNPQSGSAPGLRDVTVSVRNLSRVYLTTVGTFRRRRHSVPALTDVSLEVHDGEIFGMVGPNGAGKTTLIKILTTLLVPTTGYATVIGYDVARQAQLIRPHINFIFGGERGLYWRLSGEHNLRYFADLYCIPLNVARPRIEHLLRLVDLWDRRRERVEGYSKGMKQRLHIARALLNQPRVLFLDEPTLGLDPVAARALRKLILDIREQGTTIFLTSHYMWEMEVLCDRIAVLKGGKILLQDTPAEMIRTVRDRQVIELQLLGDADGLMAKLRASNAVVDVAKISSGQQQTLRIQTTDAADTLAAIERETGTIDRSRLTLRQPNLEDAYIQMVGDEE